MILQGFVKIGIVLVSTLKARWHMRYVLNILAGILGMVAGWVGIAALVISIYGEGNDGGVAMGAFFEIGPIGGVAGFISGAWLFNRFAPRGTGRR